jgi:hypothetical protein
MNNSVNSGNAQENVKVNEGQTSSVEQKILQAMSAEELKQAKKEVATSKMMKVQIMERTENGYIIKEENRKFGLVKENRPIKKNDVNGFLQIIQSGKYDDTQSIVTAEATELIGNYNIVDLENNPITAEDAKDYLIVLDGQHRISAFAKFNAIRKLENQNVIPNVHIKKGLKSVREYLADINMVGHNWNTADKVCVSAIASNSKLLDKANELIKDGFNPSTAMTICTGKRLKPNQLKDLITKGEKNCLPDEIKSLERADRFITIAMGITEMSVTVLTKRYFINGFNSYAAAHTEDEAFEAMGKLTIDDFKSVKEDVEFVEKLKAASPKAA